MAFLGLRRSDAGSWGLKGHIRERVKYKPSFTIELYLAVLLMRHFVAKEQK